MTRTLGIVVAGGRGRRLALDRPKALASVGGRTLLERAVAILAAACDATVVVAPRALALPALAGSARVDDPPGAEGPLAGVVAGLASGPYARAIVIGVDFPLARAAALAALAAGLAGHAAVVPAPGGVPQPLVAAYAPAAAAALAERLRAGERSITAAVATLAPRLLDDRELERLEGGLENFLNLNTPQDLERAARLLDARAAAGGSR